jgi:hypothetical protein
VIGSCEHLSEPFGVLTLKGTMASPEEFFQFSL